MTALRIDPLEILDEEQGGSVARQRQKRAGKGPRDLRVSMPSRPLAWAGFCCKEEGFKCLAVAFSETQGRQRCSKSVVGIQTGATEHVAEQDARGGKGGHALLGNAVEDAASHVRG